jgi:heme-degrading monooxygenase HmoA
MFAVIFVVQPKAGLTDEYLRLAKFLKPSLEKIDGYIDNERFGSKRAGARILSLSTWRDEKALIGWRTLGVHHSVQEKGRFEVFLDYHLRVGEIIADSQVPNGETLREQRFDMTVIGEAKFATITELTPASGEMPASSNLAADLGLPNAVTSGVVDHEVFESIYSPGKLLLLAAWKDASTAERWKPKPVVSSELRHRCVRIIREYGMFDRREAPQFYPAVQRSGSNKACGL